VATVVQGFSAVKARVQHVLALARTWALAEAGDRVAGGSAGARRSAAYSGRGDHRFAVGEDHGKRGQRGPDAGRKTSLEIRAPTGERERSVWETVLR
jgi:hypothetical protein